MNSHGAHNHPTALRALDLGRDAWPLHGAAATRRLEAHTQAKLPPFTLMARAGAALARLALALAPHARRVAVLCGPGNNGGDGFVAAGHLQRPGLELAVHDVSPRSGRPADAAWAIDRALSQGCRIQTGTPSVLKADLVIDALLGLSARADSVGPMAEAMQRLRQARADGSLVLAADLPSGLDPDTGQPLSAEPVVADHTLSMLTLKPGLFTGQGRELAGRIWWAGLGADTESEPPTARICGEAALFARDRTRRHARHKGSFGDAVVVGGALGMTGAAVLAARAALRCGAGRVYLAALDSKNLPPYDALQPELMQRDVRDLMEYNVFAQSTVVAGCGGGDAIRACLPHLLRTAARLVLDADALNAVAADAALARALRARSARALPTILTPHPLEAARLLDCDRRSVQADRLAASTELAGRFDCVVVLKGSGTVVSTPGAAPLVNATGNDRLATAGTGDVLAGWIGGLWAQYPHAQAVHLAAEAARWHGLAADRAANAGPLTAQRLIEAMAQTIAPNPAPPF